VIETTSREWAAHLQSVVFSDFLDFFTRTAKTPAIMRVRTKDYPPTL
jgi:hypothetical protein